MINIKETKGTVEELVKMQRQFAKHYKQFQLIDISLENCQVKLSFLKTIATIFNTPLYFKPFSSSGNAKYETTIKGVKFIALKEKDEEC